MFPVQAMLLKIIKEHNFVQIKTKFIKIKIKIKFKIKIKIKIKKKREYIQKPKI